MSRKQFMASHGASNRNDRYGWAFVNHNSRTVIFGAWDVNTEPSKALILAKSWEFNELGRKQNAFGEALEYVKLVANEGYSLKTFPIILDKNFDDELGTGRAKIKEYVEELYDMELEVIDGDYYAVGNHNPKYALRKNQNTAADIKDIYDSDVEDTEKETLVLARIGQGKFRRNVIDIWGNGEACALTLTSVREVLTASHIVPWSKCDSNEQRLDGANGILLCAHIDRLFDAHLLTFEKRGNRFISKLSPAIDSSAMSGLGVEIGHELCIDNMPINFKERFEQHLAAHNAEFEYKAKQ